jgi:hypothetical protein
MPKSVYLNEKAIFEILDMSIRAENPLSDATVGKLGKALGFEADDMVKQHQIRREKFRSSGEPFAIIDSPWWSGR